MFVQQNILRFYIPVGDIHFMEVFHSIENLPKYVLSLFITEVTLGFAFDVLVQGVASAVLHH